MFGWLGRWSAKRGTPVSALVAQGIVSLSIALLAGSFIDTIVYTAPVVWLFFLGTGLSLFVLRRKDPGTPRPYRVIGFPVVPIIFCACCLFMLYNCLTFAWSVKPAALLILGAILLCGVPIDLISRRKMRRDGPSDKANP
jgi:amino acid transporter